MVADQNHKAVTLDVYFYETYGNSIDNGLFYVIDWLDSDDNVLSSEYFYHTNTKTKKPFKVNGKSLSDGEGYAIDGTDCAMIVSSFPQNIVEADEGEGAEYVQLSLEDENGNATQPEGEVTVTLPYPDGVTYDNCADYDFTLEHYEDESHTSCKEIKLIPTKDGLCFNTDSFSPFLLSWGKITEENTASGGSANSGAVYYPDYDEDEEVGAEHNAETYRVICRKLNVRAGAGTSFAKLGQLQRGEIVTGKLLDSGWVEFSLADGTKAYVSGQYVEPANGLGADSICCAGEALVVCRKLNVRSGPGTSYDRVDQLERGKNVRIVACDGTHSWYKIEWNGDYAWVCAKYTQTIDE